MSDDSREPEQRDDEDFAQDLRARGFAPRTEEEQQALLEAADQEPDDDADDDEPGDEDDDLSESYGAPAEAECAPPPVAAAQAWIRANDAGIGIVFPAAHSEDRSALVKDLLSTEDLWTKRRIFDTLAAEFQFRAADFDSEIAAKAEEQKAHPELGSGDGLAQRLVGVMPRPSEDEEDEPEPQRADLSGPARARFRRQQKEVTITTIDRDPETGLIRKLITEPAPPGGTSPAPSPPLGFDPEAFYRERREQLQRQRAEAASTPASASPRPIHAEPADLAAELRAALAEGKDVDELSPALRAELLREGRKLEPLPRGPQLEKEDVGYTFADVTAQVSRGVPIVACGTCKFFVPPPKPSGTGTCRIVVGAIKGTDVCDKFSRSRTGRALAR